VTPRAGGAHTYNPDAAARSAASPGPSGPASAGKRRQRVKTKEKQEKLVEILKSWQHIENQSVAQTAGIIDKTPNSLIRLVMEIIQRDSAMHHRVQEFIIGTLEKEAVDVTPDDLAKVWGAIEAHIAAEKKTEELIAAARKSLAGTRNVVPQYLLSYLATDEEKHDKMLEDLALIKQGIYKSA
jgi:hypothetical protein